MKQWWMCALVGILMLTGMPVAAEAQPPVALSVIDTVVRPGTDMVDVYFNYDTTEYLLDGGFIIEFPADKVEILITGITDPTNPASTYVFLPAASINALHTEEGWIRIAYRDVTASVIGSGQIAKLPFRILDPDAEDEYEIRIYAERLVKWVDGVAAGENLVSDETPIEATGKIVVDSSAADFGDVDGDGNTTSTDARLILQYAVDKIGMTDLNMYTADVDRDGEVTTTDARLVLQFAVGKITAFSH